MTHINKNSLLIPVDMYVSQRTKYDYDAQKCEFEICQTGNLLNIGKFVGIFAGEIPSSEHKGVNLRRFEEIVQEVFRDCYATVGANSITDMHIENLKQISSAIIYWKMASQGGRAKLKMDNLLLKWNNNTVKQLLEAYEKKDMSLFRIGGVRIPTATAFMRFLFPNHYGIMDSRVVGKYTQRNGITTLSIRNDGYINDTKQNVIKYDKEYITFLRNEAYILNQLNIKFKDFDATGKPTSIAFRVCDVEMALFE